MKTPDPYETLGVPRSASDAAIKAAYRKRAKAAHPDKVGGSDELLQAVNQAWEILGDPEKRRRYDETGEVAGAEPMMSPAERIFLQFLDEATVQVVNEGGSLTTVIEENLRARLSDQTCAGDELKERIAKLSQHLGRYVSRATTENLIEDRLRATQQHLIAMGGNLDRSIEELREAIQICRGYADAAPPDVRYGRIELRSASAGGRRPRRVTIPPWAFDEFTGEFTQGTTRP